MKWFTENNPELDVEYLEYDACTAFDSVGCILSSLTGIEGDLEELVKEYYELMVEEDGDFESYWDLGADAYAGDECLSESAAATMDEIFNEIFTRMEQNQVVPLEMWEEEDLATEYEELLEHIDYEIGEFMRRMSEIYGYLPIS